MAFDASSLYSSAMWDEKSVYPRIESGFALKPYKNDIYVEAFTIVKVLIENGMEAQF